MTFLWTLAGLAAGYILAILTWPMLRTAIAGGIDAEIERVKARLSTLRSTK